MMYLLSIISESDCDPEIGIELRQISNEIWAIIIFDSEKMICVCVRSSACVPVSTSWCHLACLESIKLSSFNI